MKIGITIGDNDFQRTIEAFLRLYIDSTVINDADYCCHGILITDCPAPRCAVRREPVTKERIIFIWDHLKVGLYLLVQRGFRTYAGNPPMEDDLVNVAKCLTLRHNNIFLDDEIAAYSAQQDLTNNWNYEFTWVDTITSDIVTR